MATTNTEPPLVTVTNPVTYFRLWWNKVMGKEGIDFNFRICPVTAVLMVAVASTIGFGAGRIILPEGIKIPFFEFGVAPTTKPSPTEEPIWKATAYSGKLQYSITTQKYFLITTSAEAITLEVPSNLDLITLVGKRIMAVGEYNKSSKLLRVNDAKNLEILTKTPEAIPTIEPTPTPFSIVLDSPSPIPTEVIELVQ